MFQYLSDYIRFIDKADDLHFSLAMLTLQGIDLPHLLYALPPGRRWDLFRLVSRDIDNFDFVISVVAYLVRQFLFGPITPHPV